MPHSSATAVAPADSISEFSRNLGTPRLMMSVRLLHTHFVGSMCKKYMSVVSALLRKPVMTIT